MAFNTSSQLVSGSANLTISGGEASLTTNTSITASAAAATATVTINSGKPSAGQTIVLISTDGTSKTYTAVAGSATAASNQFSIDTNHDDVAFSLETAIEHSSGHNGKILVSRSVNVLALTQAAAGSSGNSSITTNMSNTEADAAFAGGSSGALIASASIINSTTLVVNPEGYAGKVGVGTASPGVQLEVQDTTTTSANAGGALRLSANDGSPMGDSHRLGVIEFTGAEDSSNTQVVGARIEALTDAAWTNAENGCALYFYTTDANNSQTNVLKIDSNQKATFSGRVVTDNATEATTTTDGSLQTDGGLSVAKSAVIGDDLDLLSDSAILSIGADKDATLTHDGTTGLTIAATPISIDSTGALDLNSTTGDINFQDGGTNQLALDLDGTAGEIIMKLMVDSDDFVFKQYDGTEVFRVEDNGDFDIAGGAGSTGVTVTAAGQLTADGRVIVDNTTDATSATDGSLQTDGGLSVAKDVIAGNDVKLLSDSAVLSLGAGSDATLTHDGTTGLTIAATPISIDSTGALDLNSTTGDINFQDGGTNQLALDLDGTSGEIIMKLMVDSDDFVFKQYDGTEVFRVEDNGDFDIAGGLGSSGVTVSAAGAISADGRIITDDSTAATSTTDGSIQTDGGLSVALDAVVGDDLILLSDSAVIHFGADKDTTLTHTDGTGLTLNSTNKLCFNDASQFIQGASATVMEIGATDEIGLTATLVDMDANLDLDGTANISGLLTIQTGIVPDAQDGAYLGTSSLQWSDLFLADGAVISFGDDNEITLTHVADDGLILKHVGTGDGKEPSFSFHAGDNDIAADDVLGSIFFKAPDEGAGTDAVLVAAGIEAVSEGDFSSSNNATKLSFKTGASETATEKVTISSAGDLSLIASNTELRFYEGGNYVGFEAPALSADQIWVLPAADGSNGQQLTTDGSGNLSWASAGSGGDGTMKSIKLNNSAVGDADIVTLDFSSNFTATESPNTEIQIGIAAAQTTITSIHATDLIIGEDAQTAIDFGTADEIDFKAANAVQLTLSDGVFRPQTDSDVDLGTSSLYFKDAFIDKITTTGNIELGHASDTTISRTGSGAIAVEGVAVLLAGAQTAITTVLNANTKIGRDSQNLIDFATTDNKIIFRVNNANEVELVENALSPVTSDGVALGTTSLMWSDLFVASGGVLNFNNGDVTVTHSSNTLTVAGGTLATAALTTSTIVASGIIKTDDSTNATSTTDGSLQTDGGLSVVLDAVFGDDVALLSDAAVLNFGANAEIKLTHVHDTGLLLTDAGGTPTLQFHDANESISSDGGHLIFTSNGVSFDFPSADGSDGQQLTTDGNGVLTWAAAGTASGAQTAITTILNTGVKIGRDSQNLIDFASTDNKIIFRVNNANEVELVENALSPVTNDGVALGTTSLMWSDLFVASGGVLNFNNGDMTVTHSSNTLTVAGGTLATAALTASTGTFSGILKTDDATDATSTTDGSLQTDGGLSVVKDAVIGDDLIMLSDAAVMHFGTNSEITLTHVHDTGLTITNTINGTDNRPCVLQLKSEEDAIVLDDVIASIEFAAGDSDGTDGATVAAGIHAIAEGTFSASANATSLVFTTGVSETAASSANAKMKLSSGGDLTVFGDTHTFSSSNTTDPLLIIKNTTNDAAGARLRFVKDKGAAGADNDIAGQIEFYADDDNQDNIKFGGIEVLVKDASNGAEGGEMILTVATHDGENQPGLVIADGDLEDEVDVNLGNGTLSTTTSMGYMKATNGFLVPEAKSLHIETPLLPSADHTATGITTVMQASENIAQFDCVYVSGNGTIGVADADAVAKMPAIGIALAAISSNAFGVILLQGMLRDDTFNFTAGNRLFVHTDGTVTATAPSGSSDVAQAIGVALNADVIYFKPDMTLVEIS